MIGRANVEAWRQTGVKNNACEVFGLGELLRSRHRLKGVPGDRHLHHCAVADPELVRLVGAAAIRGAYSIPVEVHHRSGPFGGLRENDRVASAIAHEHGNARYSSCQPAPLWERLEPSTGMKIDDAEEKNPG